MSDPSPVRGAAPAPAPCPAVAPGSALFRALPALSGRVPWVPVGTFPTPVHRLPGLAAHLGAPELWVKRDDLSAEPYGGNKVRKLEFILGAARAAGRSRLVTFGAVGSHHAFATAFYGSAAGLSVEAVMVPQPVTPHVAEMVRLNGTWLSRVWMARGYRDVPRRWAEALAADPGIRATVRVPAGGSSPSGALGYVAAAFELAEQVRAGELPEPDAVVVALGSCGTAAGLLLGLALAGLRSRLFAVRVVDRAVSNGALVAALAHRSLRLLRREDPGLALRAVPTRALAVRHDLYGPGYGHPTPEGDRAARLFHDLDGLELDPTYTGKAAAGFVDLASGRYRRRTVLYWHTLNSRPLGPLLAAARPPEALPEPLRPFAVAVAEPARVGGG